MDSLQTLANEIAIRMKAPPSTTPDNHNAHGPGGLFANPALDRGIFSAMVSPMSGLQWALPITRTILEAPLFGILTGVTATTGEDPDGTCDDPPTAGEMKLCEQYFPLGKVTLQSKVLDYSRGTRFNSRGEADDFEIIGGPLATPKDPGVPSLGASNTGAPNNEVAKRLLELAVAWQRKIGPILYNGNPVNNTAGGGYKEFLGLNRLINTGYRDAQSQVLCPAADSIVSSFGNRVIGMGAPSQNNSDITVRIANTYFQIMTRAAQAGMGNLELAIVMPYSLFYSLSEIYPIAYLTVNATTIPSGSTNFVDSGDQIRMRDSMRGDMKARTNQHLMILGQKVPVILDDFITETRVNGDIHSSTIYFVPLSAGGRIVTHLDFIDYNQAGVKDNDNTFAPAGFFRTTDNGRFLIGLKGPTNFCVQALARAEMRLVMRTPYLAARIDGVAYSHLPNILSWDPTNPSYYRNGGMTSYEGYQPQSPSYYTPV